MEKKVFVFVIFHHDCFPYGVNPGRVIFDTSISFLMRSSSFLDSACTLVEYVNEICSRIVDVIDGEYHERTK